MTRPVSPERTLLLVSITSCLIVFLLLVHAWIYPSIVDPSDAGVYQNYAFSFRTIGLLHPFGTFRTYGYPLFLYLLSFISGTDPHRLALITGVVQYGIFFSGTMWLGRLVRGYDPLLGRAVVVGLLLNPFTLSLTVDSLTEGLSTGAYVWVTAISLALAQAKSARAFTTLAVLGSSLAFFSIEIRPANILILFGWLAALCSILIWKPGRSSLRFANSAILAASLALGSFALLPQIFYNYFHYGSITPLPVCSLGEFQIKYGILAMKYDTIVHGQTAAGYNYRNPFFHGQIDGGLQWYLTNPVAGAGTIAAHLFNTMNITNIFTYIRDLRSPFSFVTRVFYWSMTVLGLRFILWFLPRFGASLASTSAARHAVVFVCASQLLLLSICSISAVETRFGVFLNGLLVVCGVRMILEPPASRAAIWSMRCISGLGLAVVACVLLSYVVDSYGSEKPFPQGLNFDFQAHRCVM